MPTMTNEKCQMIYMENVFVLPDKRLNHFLQHIGFERG